MIYWAFLQCHTVLCIRALYKHSIFQCSVCVCKSENMWSCVKMCGEAYLHFLGEGGGVICDIWSEHTQASFPKFVTQAPSSLTLARAFFLTLSLSRARALSFLFSFALARACAHYLFLPFSLTHTHTHIRTRAHTQIHTQIHTHLHTHTYRNRNKRIWNCKPVHSVRTSM